MTSISLDRVSVEIDGVTILHDISVEIPDRAFAGLAGPSGSGKTTLLRVIAGLQSPSAGRVCFDGVDVTDLPAGERGVGMAFQNPALMPHRVVERNLAFPLEIRHQTADEIRRRVSAEARALHVEHLLRRNPAELSAGEVHLVQIARTLVRVPSALLLDEPLAALDEPLALRMRRELAVLQEGYGVTTVVASNESLDFLSMCSTMIVLAAGRIVELGSPREIREAPSSLEAAQATGDLSLVPASVQGGPGGLLLIAEDADGTGLSVPATSPAFADRLGDTVQVGIRPWSLHPSESGAVRGRVLRSIPWPRQTTLCMVAGHPVMAEGDGGSMPRDSVQRFHVDSVLVFDATSGQSIT